MKTVKQWFYGIYGIRMIWHGEWADPELVWHNKSFSYYDVESPLWAEYREICEEEQRKPDENEFETWVKKNAHLARECLQNLMDNGYFYGVKGA